MKRLLLLTLLLLALAGGFAANLLLARRQTLPPLPPTPAVGHGQRLATLDLAGLTPQQAVEIIGWMQADGVQWLRLRLPWNEIEPQPGRQQWDVVQAAVDAATRGELRIVLLLDGAPAWAAKGEDAGNPLAPPHDIRDFGRFAEAVAAAYHTAVWAYQIWDEPNIAPHWGAAWADPRGYFTLLREAAASIRRADPDARIMLAALAPTRGDGAANLSDLDFLAQLYALGAAEFFDIAAAPAYGFDLPPDDPPAPDRLNFRRPELLQQVMARHGDAATPIWITAWGWWTPPAADPAAHSPWQAIDSALLSDYVNRGHEIAGLHWPWAGPLGWAEYVITPARDARRAGFALRDPGGALTPAGLLLNQLPPQLDRLGAGAHPASVGRVSQGLWRFSPVAVDPDQPGSELVIPFEGRAVAVEVQRGFYWATLTAWIDDQPAPLLPRDAQGAAYLSLHDPDNGVVVAPLARDLAPGRHELRLQASAGWGQWLLRRVVVDDQPWPADWPFWPLNFLLALAVGGAGWAWLRQARSTEGRALAARLAAGWDGAVERSAGLAPGWQVPLALALLLAFYLAPGLPLSLTALLLLALALALRPQLAPALALVALPFYLRPKMLGPVGIPVHELVIWLGCGWRLLRGALAAALGEGKGVRLSRLDAALALFLLVGLFATLNAARFGFALYDYRTVFLTPALFYWLLARPAAGAGRPSLSLLAGAVLLGATLAALVALAQMASGAVVYAEGVPRLRGLYGSANHLALYLGRVLPLIVAVSFLDHGRRRWLYAAAGLLLAAAGLLTFSKGLLLISLPVGLLTLALLQPRLRRPAALLALLGGLALLPFMGTERFTSLFDTSGGTTFLRLQLWQSAWRMWLDHPWLGVGPDNFLYAFRSFYVLPSAWEELQLSHPHNLFLDLLTRVGLFGFLAGLWLLFLTLRAGLAQIRRPGIGPTAGDDLLRLGLFAGLAAGLAHGLIDNSIFLPDLAILTLLVAAVVRRGQAATLVDEGR